MNMTCDVLLAQYGYGPDPSSVGFSTGMGGSGMGGMTMLGLLLVVVMSVVGMVVQRRLMSVMRRASEIYVPLTGAQVAESMLRSKGINDVRVTHTPGSLTDHYNPMDRTVNLSDDVYRCNSIAAVAVAAHECGHAVQHAVAYPWLGLRSRLVPLVNFGSRMGQVILILGLILLSAGSGPEVAWVGVALFGTTALFALVTLPVEFDASRRALAWLRERGVVQPALQEEARTALFWAAMTYVAAALSALAGLLYYVFLILAHSNRRSE